MAECVGAPEDTAEDPAAADESAEPATGVLEVQYITVSQAASTLIVGPGGETLLIDTGDFRDNGQAVVEYLERQNIDRLDCLVTAHPDADHIGGHARLIDRLKTTDAGVGVIYDPGITATTETCEAYLDAVATQRQLV
ncbi:MAG: putative hydrolase (metallo-beta-lactamase superfamily) [halophilic archaeon J07HX5]|nr:MAG: putative hydrolase (metallo-beta-lactamase superfamily) [halophilic archaeon J07HX5]